MLSVRKSLVIVLGALLVACTEPKAPGVLWLTYSTQIGDEQPFNWQLSVDGGEPHTVSSATTEARKYDSLSAGMHRVQITGLPVNCTTGNDDREIDVPSGDTVRVPFQVICTRVTGDVAVTVTTNGPDRDLDGYTLLLDGQPIMALPPLASVTRLVAKLTPGNHIFSLGGVASNCSVANGAATGFVTAGKSVLVLLSVDCVAVSGNLRVTTTTSGGAALADPSGYVITASDIVSTVAANGTTVIPAPAGAYTIKLSDIEPNCTAAATEKNVTVSVGASTEVTFDVSCGAYASTTAGSAATDPALDTLPNSANSAAASFDMIGLTTRYASNFMTVTLRFNRAIGTDVIVGYLDFDLDEVTTTGVPPFMNFFGGTASQGVEARLSFSTGINTFAIVSTISDNSGIVRTTVDADSVRFVIPFDRLDGDDGNLTITGIVGNNDRPTDLIPNSGVLTSHLPASASLLKRTRVPATSSPAPVCHPELVRRFAPQGELREASALCSSTMWAPPHRPR